MRVYPRYQNASFDNFQTNQDISCLKDPLSINQNIIITGGVGTGKTHLAYAIINKLEEVKQTDYGAKYYTEKNVLYKTIKEIIDDIRACWNKNADDYDRRKVEDIKTKPLLIIDEVGVQYGSDAERIELFEIFNERYNYMLPTIAISNLNRSQIEKVLGLRITDRLFGGSKVIELTGKSHR
jgi:phage replication protein, putative